MATKQIFRKWQDVKQNSEQHTVIYTLKTDGMLITCVVLLSPNLKEL